MSEPARRSCSMCFVGVGRALEERVALAHGGSLASSRRHAREQRDYLWVPVFTRVVDGAPSELVDDVGLGTARE
jgi:hypothetical protein